MTINELVIFIVIVIVISLASLFLTAASFLGGYAKTWLVITTEVVTSFSKEKQKDRIEFTYNFMNEIFKSYVSDITSSKQVDIMRDFKLEKNVVNEIQKIARNLNKQADYEFVTVNQVSDMFKEQKTFRLSHSLLNAIVSFSKPEYSNLLDITMGLKNQEDPDLYELEKTINSIFGIKVNPKNNKNIHILKLMVNKNEKKYKTKKNIERSYLSAVMPLSLTKEQVVDFLFQKTGVTQTV